MDRLKRLYKKEMKLDEKRQKIREQIKLEEQKDLERQRKKRNKKEIKLLKHREKHYYEFV